jgi:hypothetical protein
MIFASVIYSYAVSYVLPPNYSALFLSLGYNT